MNRKIITLILILAFSVFFPEIILSLSEDEYAFIMTTKCEISIWIPVNKMCDKKEQYRKDGRWHYIDKKVPCTVKVESSRTVILTDVFEGKNWQIAKENAINHYKKRGYKNILVSAIKIVN